MGFLDRLSNRRSASLSSTSAADFGDELDEHAHLVTARWGDAQRAEYLGYGVPVVVACRDLDEGRFEEASIAFEALLASAPSPAFLHRDAARARLFLGDVGGAETRFVRFLETTVGRASERERLEVHVDLASIADARGEVDRAIEWLSAPLDVDVPESDAFVALASYLRLRGFASEALAVIDAHVADRTEPASQLLTELGLCLVAAGELPRAEVALTEVVRRAKCSCGARVPPEVAAALASVYESTGRNRAAEDLLRSVGGACKSS